MSKYQQAIPDTPFHQRIARGHRIRLGHDQNAVHVSDDGILWHRVNLCCGETVPDTVATWDEHIPAKPNPR